MSAIPTVVDHVVLAARDAAVLRSRLDTDGLAVSRGRTLTGMGLANVVVPLGTSMLELHHPTDEVPTPGPPPFQAIEQQALASIPDAVFAPVTWLVRVDTEEGIRDLAARNRVDVLEMTVGDDTYLLAGFGVPLARPWIPMLIHWPPPPDRRMAADRAEHRVAPRGDLLVRVSAPSGEVEQWCGGVPAGATIVTGTLGVDEVTVPLVGGGTVRYGRTVH